MFYTNSARLLRLLILLLFIFTLTSCATTLNYAGDGNNLPPILSQDEVIRPYSSIGRIQISFDLYISKTPDLNEWGIRALREEAYKMGADAVILPELSSRPAPHLVIPAQEYRAVGVAIRFK